MFLPVLELTSLSIPHFQSINFTRITLYKHILFCSDYHFINVFVL